ncbi:MAG TPA: SMP-30/gluconolactonase/LRE family protein [Bauldia sp.]|nr:SMP-30/gluconolactonase/LRE family protein [Bauldia sp.]
MSSKSAVILGFLSAAALAAEADRIVINPKSAYPEGPAVAHGAIYYAEMGDDRVMRWNGTDNAPVWSREGCGPTSVARGTNDTLVILCDREQVLVRITRDGKTVEVISRDKNGREFLTPNASINDASGGIFWSASGLFSPTAKAEGAVMYLAPDGTLRRVAEGIHYSNGVALSPDGKLLYVSEHLSRRILAYDVGANGALSGTRVFLNLDDVVGKAEHDWDVGPDGLAMDHLGNLYIAEYGGGRLIVVDSHAKLEATISFAEKYVTAPLLIDGERRIFVTAPVSFEDPQAYGEVYSVVNPLYGKD